jgi:hypothetical protein
MAVLRKFLQAESSKKIILLQVLTVQIFVRLALLSLPFYIILGMLQRIQLRTTSNPKIMSPDTDKHCVDNHPDIQHLPWAVRATSSFVPGSRCLCQAITAQTVLALKGYPSELHIGVQKSESSNLAAHAWLVRNELVVVGNLPNLVDFIPLPTLPRVIR